MERWKGSSDCALLRYAEMDSVKEQLQFVRLLSTKRLVNK